jgi:hypothetical protein
VVFELQRTEPMAVLATFLDFLHALFIAAWALGLPLLFWQRWPRLSRAYAAYAVAFVTLNLLSDWIIGECFLTTITRHLWENAATHPKNIHEWFTVRFAELVFRLTPSHESIKLVSKALVFVTAIGVLVHVNVSARVAAGRTRRARAASARPTRPRLS